MSKVYKVEMFITDHEETIYDVVNEVQHELEYALDVVVHVTDVQESESFEWDDDLAINDVDSTKEDYLPYFKEDN